MQAVQLGSTSNLFPSSTGGASKNVSDLGDKNINFCQMKEGILNLSMGMFLKQSDFNFYRIE